MRLSFLRAWATTVSISSNLRDPRASSLERSLCPPSVSGDEPGEQFSAFDEAGKIMAEYPKWLCGRRNGLKFYYFRQDDIDNTFSVNLPFPPIFPVAYIKLLTFEQPIVKVTESSAQVSFPLTSKGLLSCNTGAEEYDGRIEMKCWNDNGRITNLETRLVDYLPSIMGRPSSFLHRYRRILYRFTQAVVHKFTMWRFHKHTWATLGEKRVTVQKKKLSAYKSRIKELEEEVDKLKRIRALEEEVEKLKSGGGGGAAMG